MARRQIQGEAVSFNMTPMIDVTFQLIIFFLLVGQFASLEKLQLKPPAPLDPLMVEDPTELAVLNVAAYTDEQIARDPSLAGQPAEWMLSATGERTPDASTQWLREQLEEAFENARLRDENLTIGQFKLEIRADRGVHYAYMTRVFSAAAQLGLQEMNIVAAREE